MLPRLHVGVTVWPARSDFFYFLRNWARLRSPAELYNELSLPAHLLEIVSKIEYSPLWIFRVFVYRKIAQFLEQEVASLMREAEGKYREVVFYIPDDGYWAELFNTIRDRVGGSLKLLNVQHGQPALRVRRRTLRRLVNRIAIAVTGYPNFGYGFGAGTLDGYIVMSNGEREFIRRNFVTAAYVAPQFIRGDFFAAAQQVDSEVAEQKKIRILFAMNPIFGKKSNFLGRRDRAEATFYSDIADCLREIAIKVPSEIQFRFHPGQNTQIAERKFREAGLNGVAEIDRNFRILDSLMECDFVLAYGSTVLLEVALLGKVPINFVPVEYPPSWTLVGRAEMLKLHRGADGIAKLETSRGSLSDLFSRKVMDDYAASISPLNYDVELPCARLNFLVAV